MSHTTTIKTVKVTDIAALRQAVADLKKKGVKCDLAEGAKPRMYYSSQHGVCDYVLKLHDAPYDVGFDKQQDGSYVPVFDAWQGHIGKQVGAACPMPASQEGRAQHAIGQLMQGYAVHAATNAATNQGYTVTGYTTDADGSIHLEIEV